MISLQNNFLFIHVPKTGGSSIQTLLKKYSEDQLVPVGKGEEGFEISNAKYNITKHSTLSHYKSVLDSKTYSKLFKFAIIRNPYERMISYYFSPHWCGNIEWNKNAFLRLIKKTPTLRHYICETSLIAKQFSHLGINININKKRKIDSDIDFLMKFEHLEDDFKLVCEKLGIPYSPIPKIYASNRLHYSEYYDDHLKYVVYNKFIEEITYGNYNF